jgi:hypothetical protein
MQSKINHLAAVPSYSKSSACENRLDSKAAPEGMEQLLRGFGCNPTDIKVGSEAYATPQHESSYVCEYNIEENCLNDPELCNGVSKVVGQNAYLLDYEAGSFPIIEASRLHYLVDAKSDLFTSGIPGRRNALGIRRRQGPELQIILSIDVLRNGFSSLGGYVAGIEENMEFAIRIIDFLDRAVRMPDSNQTAAYESFAKLERMLGQLVYDVLICKSTEDKIDSFLPERVKKKITSEKTQQLDYCNAYFADIVEILRENWQEFEPYFKNDDRSSVSKILFGVNSSQRIHLAHPHKAHQLGIKFGQDDIRVLNAALALVQNARSEFGKHANQQPNA